MKLSNRAITVAFSLLAVALVVGSIKYAHLCQDIKFINDQLESTRNALAAADIRIAADFGCVWIPQRCDECKGEGRVEGLTCEFCDNGVFTDDIKGQKIKCPVCLGTGKRIGDCPMCRGSGTLYLEKRVKAGE
jgi:DnaJ-class molecular chaperone